MNTYHAKLIKLHEDSVQHHILRNMISSTAEGEFVIFILDHIEDFRPNMLAVDFYMDCQRRFITEAKNHLRTEGAKQ